MDTEQIKFPLFKGKTFNEKEFHEMTAKMEKEEITALLLSAMRFMARSAIMDQHYYKIVEKFQSVLAITDKTNNNILEKIKKDFEVLSTDVKQRA